ncbi:MAG: F0F1 ATP synthase subunit B [Planctomycetota bacterium]
MNRKWLLAALLVLPLFAARGLPVSAEHSDAATPVEQHDNIHHAGYFELNGGLVKVLIVQVIAFVLLYLALKKWAFPVLAGMLKARADKIRDTYAKLEKEKEELSRLTKMAQEKLAGIEKEAQAKVDAAIRDGNAQKAAILEEAGTAAARILAKAKSEIEMERAKAIEEIRQEMVRLSLEAAERLVKQQLTASKQEELVERFIAGIEKVRA